MHFILALVASFIAAMIIIYLFMKATGYDPKRF
jgi:hypothetical protein